MTITLLPDAPDPATDTPTVFSQKAAASVLAQKAMVVELNAMLASLDSVSAGGALSIPYTFSTTTADSDPGAGKLRLNTSTQSSATIMRCDVMSMGGVDLSTVLDQFNDSTSVVKGDIRLVKTGDVTKWLSFKLTATSSPTGYRNFTVAHVGGSADNPFADGDGLVMFFTRTGDKGDVTSNTEYTAVPVPALNINLGLGNYQTLTVAGNVSVTFSNAPANGWSCTLLLKLDSGSAAFPSTVRPVNGIAIPMAVGKTHRVMFDCPGGGLNNPVGMVIAPNFTN